MQASRILFAVAVLVSCSAFASAEVGKPAPDFSLTDLDGKAVKLADFKGKTVVLEWFNPECPYVKRAHTKGSLVDTAARRTKDSSVVWLAVNSGAPGKQGHGVELNRSSAKGFGLSHAILIDESGAVGKSYGATNTPHMFVVDKAGTLVYRGAIDNSPDGEKGSPTGGTLVNYVDAALDDLAAGRAIKTADTKAYGCSVKYGKAGAKAAVTPTPPTPPESKSTGSIARVEKGEWAVVMEVKAPVTAGEKATAHLTFEGKGGYHVNAEYPVNFRPAADGTVKFEGDKISLSTGLTKEKCAGSDDVCKASAELPFSATTKGSAKVAGTLAFSVCDPSRCLIEKAPLALNLDVK